MALHMDRGIEMLYRDGFKSTYFPTEDGWKFFREFVDLCHRAEPFRSKALYNDVFQAFNTAFARIISRRMMPDIVEDFFEYLPEEFYLSLTTRSERAVFKVNGVECTSSGFSQVGNCWIGSYSALDLDFVALDDDQLSKVQLEGINEVYEDFEVTLVTEPIQGTSDFAKRQAVYQCEITEGLLGLLLNVSYERVFHRLWSVRSMHRPEHGFSRHRSFSFVRGDRSGEQGASLSTSTKFIGEQFKIDDQIIDRWHTAFGLSTMNRILATSPNDQTDLQSRWLNALLFFRQSSLQPIPEMQMSTLWICVEAFFTADNERVIEALLPGLVAITIYYMNPELWPANARTLADLERRFKKYYSYRSKTFHHGARGHVSETDVQDFSWVGSNLIMAIAHLIGSGIESTEDLHQRCRMAHQTLKEGQNS